jgi:hypothetical protein
MRAAAKDKDAAVLEGELESHIAGQQFSHLTRLETDPGVALDIRADPASHIGVEDDPVMFFVEPKGAGVEIRLSVPRRGDVSHFGCAQEGTDPVIITLVLWQTLIRCR